MQYDLWCDKIKFENTIILKLMSIYLFLTRVCKKNHQNIPTSSDKDKLAEE